MNLHQSVSDHCSNFVWLPPLIFAGRPVLPIPRPNREIGLEVDPVLTTKNGEKQVRRGLAKYTYLYGL